MTNNKLNIKYYTSPWNKEREIRAPYWGASLELGLLPFQVRLLKAKVGDSTSSLDSLEGFEFNRLARFNTPLETSEHYDLSIAGWGHNIYNCYFFPNPVTTIRSKGRRLSHKHSGKTKLAGLFFIPVDIDFNLQDGFGYEEAMELIDALPIKPDVIVYTGNGIQIYWSIQHTYIFPSSNKLVYPDTELQFQSSSNIEQRAVTLLKMITELVGGDQSPSHAARGIMRIPETYNFKIKDGEIHITKGHYIYGNLVDAYHNPQHNLEELISCYCPEFTKKCNSAVDLRDKDAYEYQFDKRPLPDLENVDEAFSKFLRKLNLKKVRKNMFKFFKIVYGYRKLYRYMEHRESDSRTNGIHRKELKKERDFFTSNGFIERISEHEFTKNKRVSAFYRPTEKFYEYIEEHRILNIGSIEQISTGIYEAGHSNQGMLHDYTKLRGLGVPDKQIELIIKRKIERNKETTNYMERLERLKYLIMI